jgi:hypothetical protein
VELMPVMTRVTPNLSSHSCGGVLVRLKEKTNPIDPLF